MMPDVNQTDMYQFYSCGKKYGCEKVALIYPRTDKFKKNFYYRFDDKLSLYCFHFDVAKPKECVDEVTGELFNNSNYEAKL